MAKDILAISEGRDAINPGSNVHAATNPRGIKAELGSNNDDNSNNNDRSNEYESNEIASLNGEFRRL